MKRTQTKNIKIVYSSGKTKYLKQLPQNDLQLLNKILGDHWDDYYIPWEYRDRSWNQSGYFWNNIIPNLNKLKPLKGITIIGKISPKKTILLRKLGAKVLKK